MQSAHAVALPHCSILLQEDPRPQCEEACPILASVPDLGKPLADAEPELLQQVYNASAYASRSTATRA